MKVSCKYVQQIGVSVSLKMAVQTEKAARSAKMPLQFSASASPAGCHFIPVCFPHTEACNTGTHSNAKRCFHDCVPSEGSVASIQFAMKTSMYQISMVLLLCPSDTRFCPQNKSCSES